MRKLNAQIESQQPSGLRDLDGAVVPQTVSRPGTARRKSCPEAQELVTTSHFTPKKQIAHSLHMDSSFCFISGILFHPFYKSSCCICRRFRILKCVLLSAICFSISLRTSFQNEQHCHVAHNKICASVLDGNMSLFSIVLRPVFTLFRSIFVQPFSFKVCPNSGSLF